MNHDKDAEWLRSLAENKHTFDWQADRLRRIASRLEKDAEPEPHPKEHEE